MDDKMVWNWMGEGMFERNYVESSSLKPLIPYQTESTLKDNRSIKVIIADFSKSVSCHSGVVTQWTSTKRPSLRSFFRNRLSVLWSKPHQ
jgi:hypothetical protein